MHRSQKGTLMAREFYRFSFASTVPRETVAELLGVAVFVAECLHGKVAVQMGADCHLDEGCRTCLIGTDRPEGMVIARVLVGLLGLELKRGAFTVNHSQSADVAA